MYALKVVYCLYYEMICILYTLQFWTHGSIKYYYYYYVNQAVNKLQAVLGFQAVHF